MTKRASFLAAALLALGVHAHAVEWPAGLPVYDHVVIVVEENKDYEEVIGEVYTAPYINGVLKAEGANFSRPPAAALLRPS